MKIISKFKDYYDYCQGVYGIDELRVLDRTKFTAYKDNIANQIDFYGRIRFIVCDYVVDCVVSKGKFYYGSEILKVKPNLVRSGHYFVEPYYIGKFDITSTRHGYVLQRPTLWSELYPTQISPNRKLNCPILVNCSYWYEYDKHPILREYDFAKAIPAEQMWLLLSDWLSRDADVADNRTDNEKILSNGFDLKTSFRK